MFSLKETCVKAQSNHRPSHTLVNSLVEHISIDTMENQVPNLGRRNSDNLEDFNDFLYWREPFAPLDIDEILLIAQSVEHSNKSLNKRTDINNQNGVENSLIETVGVHERQENMDIGERMPTQPSPKVKKKRKKNKKTNKNPNISVPVASQTKSNQNAESIHPEKIGKKVICNFVI